MNEIKISIVIPVYNAESTIEKCIRSILEQDVKEIEVICVDDCSKDNSFEVLQKVAEKDDRIVVLRNDKNEGTLITRMRGIREARGEYIMFADNDDWYVPNVFSKLYTEIKSKDIDILMYGFRPVKLICREGKEVTVEQYRDYAIPTREEYRGDHCIYIENRLNLLWNKIIKMDVCKQAYDNIKEMYMTVAEDTYACWLIHYFAKSFEAIEDICYEWDCNDGASTYHEISFEPFRNLCNCMKNYEDSVAEFFRARNETELLEFFKNGKKEIGYNYCIKRWRTTVPVENAAEGLRMIIDIYGADKICRFIQTEWVDVIHRYDAKVDETVKLKKKNDKLIAKTEKLQQKNETLNKRIDTIKKSKAYRIGRALTAVPRKLKG